MEAHIPLGVGLWGTLMGEAWEDPGERGFERRFCHTTVFSGSWVLGPLCDHTDLRPALVVGGGLMHLLPANKLE